MTTRNRERDRRAMQATLVVGGTEQYQERCARDEYEDASALHRVTEEQVEYVVSE